MKDYTAPIFDLPEYEFTIQYNAKEKAGNKPEEYIKITSNIFSVESILNRSISDLNIPLEKSKDGFFLADDNNKIDYYSKYYHRCFDIKDLLYTNSSETIVIRSDNSISLNGLFDFFHYYYHNIFKRVVIERLFASIRTQISIFPEKAKLIPLKRLFNDKVIISIFQDTGAVCVRDLLNTIPFPLSYAQALEVYDTLINFDVSMPRSVLQSILETLSPRELEIIRKRYLDENGATLESVGEYYSLTRERVRQLESKASRKLAHPSKNKLKQRLIELLKLYGKYDSFFSQEDIATLDLPKNSGVFFDKVLHIFSWNTADKIAFYNAQVELQIINDINELPSDLPLSDLEEYATMISEGRNRLVSADEIKVLALRQYRKYGMYLIRGRMTLRVAIPYLLNQYFPNGIDLYNDKSLDLLRQKAREDFDGYELAENNRAIQARLPSYCIPIGRGIWKLDTNDVSISKELSDHIVSYVEEYQSPVIPIKAVWDHFVDDLSKNDITNKYHLQGQLKKILPKDFSVNRDYIFKDSGESFYSILEAFVKEANAIVTKADFQKNFPGITDIVIQQAAANTKILNMNGYYVHLDNLNVSLEEQTIFKESVDEIITTASIYHAKVIFNLIRRKNSGLFSRIGITHYLQFYYLLKELYPEDYSFYRPFVGKPGIEMMSGEAQVLDQMSHSTEITIAGIREIARSVGTIIDRYIEFIDRNNDLFVFKNRNAVIMLDAAGIEDSMFANLDSILTEFIGDKNYRSLQEFFDYWKLPTLNCAWNEWLLYSIINKYSIIYKTAVSSNYLAEAIPIVAKQDLDESLIDYHNVGKAKSEDDPGENDLLDLLDYEDLEANE